jgi:hypothetical protein
MLPLFAATLVLSAFLMFSLQPLFAKLVLPLFGGSAAVWNTAMVFFQATLLAGYLYAHVSARLLPFRTQVLVHGGFLVVAFAVLPVEVAAGWTAPVDASPVLWLITLLALSVGLPFAAISATAPLLQSWFSQSGHRTAGDPYFLYGASNLGSLAALLSYPIMIEPFLGLGVQGVVWSGGYAMLAGLIGLCAVAIWRAPPSGAKGGEREHLVADPGWRLRLRWLVLAFVPSSLLLGVTLHISTDVAAVPFLWIMPLAIYLFSFVLVFARRPILKHDWMVRGLVPLLIPVVVLFDTRVLWLIFLLHLLALFVIAMVCHGEAARRRPVTRHLTEFYLWLSLGGVLGGMFAALVAPAVFDTTFEYPLVLVLACLLCPVVGRRDHRQWAFDLALLAILLVVVLATPIIVVTWADSLRGWHWRALQMDLYGRFLGLELDVDSIDPETLGDVIVIAASGLILLSFHGRPQAFAGGVAILLFVGQLVHDLDVPAVHERSFFGVYSIYKRGQPGESEVRVLRNGRITHGAQSTDPRYSHVPLTYYGTEAPLGQAIAALNKADRITHMAAVGLGVGTVACYRRPGQSLTFYEIDPVVERLARDPRYFTFLENCGAGVDVVIGDGRLALAEAPDKHYDLMILDAYSSDSIPVHLMTREALALYFEKLADGGIALFHISNRYLNLAPVLANLAADAGFAAGRQHHRVRNTSLYVFGSHWIAIARTPEDLAVLNGVAIWQPLLPDPESALWTDDFSNVFSALKW